jgi:hypothetical protein
MSNAAETEIKSRASSLLQQLQPFAQQKISTLIGLTQRLLSNEILTVIIIIMLPIKP